MEVSRGTSYFLMLAFLVSCSGNKEQHADVKEITEVKVKADEVGADIKIPSKVWDMLEFKAVESHSEHAAAAAPEGGGHGAPAPSGGEHGGGSGGGAPAATVGEKKLLFSEVSIILTEKNPGIIRNQSVKIALPAGGGTVDLSAYVTGKQGSFFVKFDFPHFAEASTKKVIFISGAKKRKIGNEIFGAGCSQYFDISDKFFKEMSKEGLKVNTTQERYISVLGGTFLFAAKNEEGNHVAQVTFKHSEFAALFCKEEP